MHAEYPGASFAIDPLENLTTAEFYECLRLRSEVFVVEQACAYQDLDGLDSASLHLRFVEPPGRLLAYARLLPPGLDFPDSCAIGRIVTSPRARRRGCGRLLVREAIAQCRGRWPSAPIRIRAQTYLLSFYTDLGFVAEGDGFLEDGIPHQQMRFAGRPEGGAVARA